MATSSIATDTEVLNAQVFYDELDRLMGASIGVIAVRTREMQRGRLLMHQWSSLRGMDFHVWDVISGFRSYRPLPISEAEGDGQIVIEADNMKSFLEPSGRVDGTADIMGAMAHYAVRQTTNDSERNKFCGVMLGVVPEWLAEPIVHQLIRDHVQRAYQCDDRMILFLTPGTVIPDAIVGDVEVIDLPTPSFAELREALMELEGEIPENSGFEMTEEARVVIVQNGMGMTQQEFENAFSLAIVDLSATIDAAGDEGYVATVDDFTTVIRQRKLEVLKQSGSLELMPDAKMSTVGGLDLLKEELEEQKHSFGPEARAYGIKPPKGFLVVGPPGTGKTLVAQATAAALGVAGIKFEFASVFGSLVGQSEAKAKAAFRMIREAAPCVAFIDEIDKAVGDGGGGGDGGTTKRVFGMLLTWMQENANLNIPVLVVASANNVEHIPPELMRKGRFDDIWAVSFPSPKDRAAIFKIHVEKRGHKLTDADYRKLAEATNLFVGAEIETVVEAALRTDFLAGEETVTVETILKKIDGLTPQAKVFPAKIQAMRAWCESNARPASREASFEIEEAEEPKGDAVGIKRIKRVPRLASRSKSN